MKAGWLLFTLTLAACSASTPPPYQADRDPEERDSYHGAQGMQQYVKDQSYLQKKALQDNCDAARLALVEAQAAQDGKAAEDARQMMTDNCKNTSS